MFEAQYQQQPIRPKDNAERAKWIMDCFNDPRLKSGALLRCVESLLDEAVATALEPFKHNDKAPPAANDPGYWGWLQCFTGSKFFPLQPDREPLDIRNFAHGCALENRYGGQTMEPYSVAQHCCVVHDIVRDMFRRPDISFEALMHDAVEGHGLKDLPRDVKMALPEYKERLEHPFEQVIAKKWKLAWPWDPLIKKADNIALMTERRDLFAVTNADWKQMVEPLAMRLEFWDWRRAEEEFLKRFFARAHERMV